MYFWWLTFLSTFMTWHYRHAFCHSKWSLPGKLCVLVVNEVGWRSWGLMFKSQQGQNTRRFHAHSWRSMVLIPLHQSSASSSGSVTYEKINSNNFNRVQERPTASMTSYVHNTVTSWSKFHFPPRGYDTGKMPIFLLGLWNNSHLMRFTNLSWNVWLLTS